MPGAGKSTASEALEKKGWKKLVMGDIIREETRRLGLEPDEKNTGFVMRKLREQYGEEAIARLIIEQALKHKYEKVVVDGIRSLKEVNYMKRFGTLFLIAIQASPKRRFELLTSRGRTDDPENIKEFENRDMRELSIGISEAIALADECISNENISKEELQNKTVECVEIWLNNLRNLK